MTGEFTFPDFNAYQPSSMNAFADGSHTFQPLQPNHGAVYGNQVHSAHPPPQYPQNGPAKAGEKRKADVSNVSTPQGNLEELSRQAAEDDKRRRNTAASARFRIKKKQREQALEKSAKEMTDKVTTLESRVSQLETENKWLKNLLVEKNEGSEDITALWKEFTKQAGKRGKPEVAKDDR